MCHLKFVKLNRCKKKQKPQCQDESLTQQFFNNAMSTLAQPQLGKI